MAPALALLACFRSEQERRSSETYRITQDGVKIGIICSKKCRCSREELKHGRETPIRRRTLSRAPLGLFAALRNGHGGLARLSFCPSFSACHPRRCPLRSIRAAPVTRVAGGERGARGALSTDQKFTSN